MVFLISSMVFFIFSDLRFGFLGFSLCFLIGFLVFLDLFNGFIGLVYSIL